MLPNTVFYKEPNTSFVLAVWKDADRIKFLPEDKGEMQKY